MGEIRRRCLPHLACAKRLDRREDRERQAQRFVADELDHRHIALVDGFDHFKQHAAVGSRDHRQILADNNALIHTSIPKSIAIASPTGFLPAFSRVRYTAVVCNEAWPSRAWISETCRPRSSSSLAKVCRMVWTFEKNSRFSQMSA